MHEVVVCACRDAGVGGFPRADEGIELRASLQKVFEPLYLGDFADLVRDLCEDVVVERVTTDEIAKCSEGCEFFFDAVFDLKKDHVAGMQCAEYNGDVREQLAARQGNDAYVSA